MIDSDIRDQTYQFFLEEAPDLLQILETGLLNLKHDRSPALIHDLMRSAHSIKGGAATVGLDTLATISHRLETILRGLHSDKIELDSELETWLLEAYDTLREPLQQQIDQGGFDTATALKDADRIFTKIEDRLGDVLKEADNYLPSSSDLGVDMVSSIFEVDVAQGIERLAKVLENPQEHEVVGELRAQAEVFAGFAEILNLPGFAAIAQTASKAVDAHPERVLEIISLALADFRAARELILAGDRAAGGSPSEALTAFLSDIPSRDFATQALISTQAPTLLLNNNLNESLDNLDILLSEDEEINLDSLLPEDEEINLEFPTEALIDFESEAIAPTTEVVAEVESSPQSQLEPLLIEDCPQQPRETVTDPAKVELSPEFHLQLLSKDCPSQQSSSEQGSQTVATTTEIVAEMKSSPRLAKDLSLQQSSPSKSQIQSVSKYSSTANSKVKVDLDRLEKMNNLVGELVIDRNSLALQQEQLQTIVQKIQQGLGQFQNLATLLEKLSEQAPIGFNGTSSAIAIVDPDPNPQSEPFLSFSIHNEPLEEDGERLFDSLEMENYEDRHSSVQEVLEQMMQLEEAVEDLALFSRQSDRTIRQQEQTLTKLRDELMWARMLPLEKILKRFPRSLRDLSTRYNKPVNLEMKGTEILVDKGILEKLYDPLMHLIRNAFDHGIEPPELRRKQGKPQTGNITIQAAHRGNNTLIEISDDGRGLDLMKIAQRAIDRGWLSVEQLTQTDKKQLLDFIFEPGFSTADKVSELSGRGVGLDVVRSQLQAVKGTVKVDSSPGKGTTFILSLPLTLTIAKLLVCSVGTTLLALPVASIQEIIPSSDIQANKVGTQRVISWRDELLPVHRLSDLLEYRYPALINQNKTLANGSAMLIIRSEKSNFALEVEDFGTEQEMVIKPVTGGVPTPEYVYGCTVLGDGNLIPAIDAVALLAHTKEQKERLSQDTVQPFMAAYQDLSATTARVPTVLVVDDSAMMRKTLALTLQKVGYRVLQARDGKEAIELLLQNSSIDLIVSDLEMPKLNGFEFLNHLRQDPVLSLIPVVMLTTRSNDKHRQLALHLGASAYMSKPYIEQEFLDVLRNTVDSKSNRQSKITPLPHVA